MVRELWRKSGGCRGYLKLADLAEIGEETTILQSLKKKVAHTCAHSGKAVKKECTRFEKSRFNAWKHLQPLTPMGIIEMEEAFKNINAALYRFHGMEMEDHHAATVSKKSASKREYTVINSQG